MITRALIVTLFLAAEGCGHQAARPLMRPGQLKGWNVLLVTLDTLRRDRIGAYGHAGGLTPAIDRLADGGIRYTQAFAHVPMTLPAHTSILTGLTPAHHGVRNNMSYRLDDRVPTLATQLKSAGYRTGAFVGAFVLDARFGLSRGFDRYDDRFLHESGAATFRISRRLAPEVLGDAGDWILHPTTDEPSAVDGTPWFAWIHLFDAHAPYEAPPEFQRGRTPYEAAVAFTDASLGRFLERMRSGGALDRTLVVLTADHGESLGDHGETTHGLFAYNATLAVPLIVAARRSGAGGEASFGPATIDTPAGHSDIMPTVLDLVGVPTPAPLDGRSLVSPPPADRELTFEALDANLTRGWAPLVGIVYRQWKYIALPIPELYDLSNDRDELTNLADRDPGRRDAMARQLQIAVAATGGVADSRRDIDSETAARLRALGYVGGSTMNRRTGPYTERDDPKRLIGLSERFTSALERFNRGDAESSLSEFLALLQERPDFVTARTSAATVLLSQHRASDAVTLLRQAPRGQADSPDLLAKLGTALSEAEDYPHAAGALEQARQAGDQNPDLFNDLGVVYAHLGRVVEARRMFDELLRRDPLAAGTWYNLGLVNIQAHQSDAAVEAFQQAVRADPTNGEAWRALGAVILKTNRTGAIDAWKRAERLRPSDYDLLFNLGMTIAEGTEPSEALPYLRRFEREAPRDRYAGDLPLVQTRITGIERGLK